MSDPRPVVLVVEQEYRDLTAVTSRLSGGAFRVASCPMERVALEYCAESRPAVVLLDARTLYLEGPACLERWGAASPGTRVFFVDVDGPWCLLMELPDGDLARIAINPCPTDGLAPAVEELLSRNFGKEDADDRLAVLAV